MLDNLATPSTLLGEARRGFPEAWRGDPDSADRGNARRHHRSEPRYPAIQDRLWLQWWEGGEYLGRSARLVNVSRHGAMIVSFTLFRVGQTIRLFLEEPAPQVGVEALVLAVVEGVEGMHQVRLAFPKPCPEEFFQAASNGFESWLAGKAH